MTERYLFNQPPVLEYYPALKLLELIDICAKNLDGDTVSDILDALEKRIDGMDPDNPEYDDCYAVFHEANALLDRIGYWPDEDELSEAS